MLCISAYEYDVVEVKMSKMFAIYRHTSGFPSKSSEYAFQCCRKQLWRYGNSLLCSTPGVDLFTYFIPCSWSEVITAWAALGRRIYIYIYIYMSNAEWDMLFSVILLQVVYDVCVFCHWVPASESSLSLWLFSSSVFFSLFVTTFVSTFYMFDSRFIVL